MTIVARVLANTLKDLGVKYVFGVPSGNWVDYLAAIKEVPGLEFILVTNEGSGGVMADVCWRLTGKIAACFGTLGPGACNQTTGVCGGYLDRSPMLAFSDEVDDTMLGRTSQMNIDHQTLFKPLTKWTTRLEAGKVKQILYNAFDVATAEVPGPVHIGLPAGMGADESPEETVPVHTPAAISDPDPGELFEMAALFTRAKKPLLALGITALRSNVREAVFELIEKFRIPVVLTPMAKGLIPEHHPCYAGVLAHALGDQVGAIHQTADLIVGIGYDPVELNYEDWMPRVPLVHIDTVPADLDTENYTLGCDVVGCLKSSVNHLLALDGGRKEWCMDRLAEHRNRMFEKLIAPRGTFGPRRVLDGLRTMLPEDGIMTCDVGAHLHLIGQHWKTYSPECQLMTNGCSSMGFAIPSAIAAKLSCPDRIVCCVVGDGGFYMTAGEIVTAMRLNTDIVVVVLMDASLSLIEIKQEKKGHEPYGTNLRTSAGKAVPPTTLFGAPVFIARDEKQYDRALKDAFNFNGPAIVEAYINPGEYRDLILKGNKS